MARSIKAPIAPPSRWPTYLSVPRSSRRATTEIPAALPAARPWTPRRGRAARRTTTGTPSPVRAGGGGRGQAVDAEEGRCGQAHDDRDHEPDQGGAGRVPGGRPNMPDGEQRQDDDVSHGPAQPDQPVDPHARRRVTRLA